MSAIMAHHRKARVLDILLYDSPDILHTIACTSRRDTPIKCVFCDLEQTLHFWRDLPHRDGYRRIGMPAMKAGGEVKSDDITLVQNTFARYAMNYFFVY